MPALVHFEMNADDPGRVANFHTSVFGLKILKWKGSYDYWLIPTEAEGNPGLTGAISRRADNLTAVNSIGVSAVDEFAQKVVAAGGKIVQPKMIIPAFGHNIVCQDTEENIFNLWRVAPAVK